MHIVVFGGAFDPPHVGHQSVVEYLLSSEIADEIWMLPAKHHPFAKKLTSDEHRLAMLEFYRQESVKIETYELTHQGTSYTYRTLTKLQEKYPDDHFSFVIGSDNVKSFILWDKYKELLEEFDVFVYPRAGYSMQSLLPGMIPLKNAPTVSISSSDIKEKILSHQSIAGLVLEPVLSYIQEHGLYQS